jgi:putative oxidoreductase
MATASNLAVPAAKSGRALNVTLWAIQILLAALFVFGGASKLIAGPEVVAAFDKIGFGQWFRVLTGSLEVLGGIGIVLPRFSGVAALELLCVMVGAVLTHVLVLPPVGMAAVPGTLAIVLALIAYARRSQFVPLRRRLHRAMGNPAVYASDV